MAISQFKRYLLQVCIGNDWVNYSLEKSIGHALRLADKELEGERIRVIGWTGCEWVECIIGGSLENVQTKDFRLIAL